MLADMVSGGGILADVGCDHGFLSIYLVSTKKVERAIAMDLRPGPLEKAKENIRTSQCADRIETRLSDGLQELVPNEADHILIAGLGGAVMLHILQEGERTAKAAKELILQPQSELYEVRRFLWEQGYDILEEQMVEEEGKFYPMMKAAFCGKTGGSAPGSCPSEAQLMFGGKLLEKKHPVLKRYLEREKEIYRKLKESLEKIDQPGKKILERREEICRRLDLISQTLETWKGSDI